MPALKRTDFAARVLWLGSVTDREAQLASVPRDSLPLSFAGPDAEEHAGLTRPSCSRVLDLYPRGTEIRNVRQLSIISVEELAVIARKMGVGHLDPSWLGATMLVEGLEDFTHLPPSSRLQGPDGCTLVVDMENRSCMLPAKEIEAHHPGQGKLFKSAAAGRRGVTAWVEREGRISLGDSLQLFVPDQPAWAGLSAQGRLI